MLPSVGIQDRILELGALGSFDRLTRVRMTTHRAYHKDRWGLCMESLPQLQASIQRYWQATGRQIIADLGQDDPAKVASVTHCEDLLKQQHILWSLQKQDEKK